MKIGDFTINLVEHSLVGQDGAEEFLQPKFVEVLHYLAQRYPHLVSRQELIDQIWDGNNYVGDKALTNAIWHIRSKLHQGEHEYIQTVRKSGYKLIQPPILSDSDKQSSGFERTPVSPLSNRTWVLICAVILVTSMFTGILLWPSTDLSESQPVVENVTSSPGREAYPAISPDGNKLVYYWKHINQEPDLYLQELRQPDLPPQQLTFDSHREYKPVWDKSGDTIYYAQKSWNRDRCHIIALDLVSKSQTVLANCRPSVNAAVTISNDGTMLAFNGIDPDSSASGIYLLDLSSETRTPKRFSCSKDCNYSDRDAAFSPDDNQFAIIRRSQKFEEDIFLVDRGTGATKRLTTGKRDVHGMAWLPNSNKLVFSAEHAQTRQGFVIDMDDFVVTPLDVTGFSYPTVWGDSNAVAFHDWQVKRFISSLDLNKTHTSLPFPVIQSGFSYDYVDFNEIVEKVAYISNQSGYKELWAASWDGTGQRQLTSLKDNLFFPRWSPDGSKIAFLVLHYASRESSVNIVDIQTGIVTVLPDEDFIGFDLPNWSLDGTSILTEATLKSTDETGYYRIDIASGEYREISPRSGGYIIEYEPDNYWFSTSNKAIFKLDLRQPGGQPTEILPPETLSGEYSWLLSDGSLYYLQNYTNHQQINQLELGDMQLSIKLKAPLRSIERNSPLAMMQQKQQLLFTQTFFPQVDIKKLTHPLLESE